MLAYKTCKVCNRKATRYGAYCNSCSSRNRRHGHPLQETITATALKPFRVRVRKRLEKNPKIPPYLKARWEIVVKSARALAAKRASGQAMHRYTAMAALEIVKLADQADFKDVAETAVAVFLMRFSDDGTRRFRTDRSCAFQLVRRVRACAAVNVGVWKGKRVYRDFAPRAVPVLSKWLTDVFGLTGVKIAELERRDAAKEQQEKQEFRDAVAAMT